MKTCNDCRHYKHAEKLNPDEGYCTHPSKTIYKSLHWLQGKPTEPVHPCVNAYGCYCYLIEEVA